MVNAFLAPSPWMARVHERSAADFEEKLTRLVRAAHRGGAEALLVTELCADAVLYVDDDHAIRDFHRSMEAVARREGAYFLDLFEPLVEVRDGFPFVDSVHLSPFGHEVVARELEPVIRSILGLAGGDDLRLAGGPVDRVEPPAAGELASTGSGPAGRLAAPGAGRSRDRPAAGA